MATHSGTAMKSLTIITLMILTAMVPLVDFPTPSIETQEEKIGPQSLELGERQSFQTGARAPCPSTQNDGGTSGDAAGGTSTTKSFGTDPTTSSSLPGCVDATDRLDFYTVNLTAGKDFTVELTVPSGADFDLYLKDSTNTTYLAFSEYNDPLESFTYIINSSNAGTFYVVVSQYASDGNYGLEMWTNSSAARPDLTVSGVTGPSTASTGASSYVSFTVNNIGAAALNSSTPYDIPIILSSDTTYDSADTVLNVRVTGPNLASGASQNMNVSVTIPSSLGVGSYYWIVWADGWANVTESNELNNNNYSSSTTSVSTPGLSADVLEPNDSTANASMVSSLPFAYNLSIHTATDDDYFEVVLVSGVTYWFNATFTHANGDLDMDLTSGTTQLAGSGSTTDNEAINYTATSNMTAHLYVYGWGGDTNNYQLTIESGTSSPSRTESIAVFINGPTQWTGYLLGLTSGTSYSIAEQMYWFNGTGWQYVDLSWNNFTASTSYYFPVTNFSGELWEGEWYVYATLYDNSGSTPLYLDMNSDYIDIEKMTASVTSNTGGTYTAQNLTVGNTYAINWYLLEGTFTSGNWTLIDYGATGNFTATSTNLTNSVSWNLPSNYTQHEFIVELIDSNGDWEGEGSDFFTPTRNESIYVYLNNRTASEGWMSGLTSGTSYGVYWELYWFNGTGWQFDSQLWDNFTATSNSELQIRTLQLLEGEFCIYADLYDNSGSTPLYLDSDNDCDYIEMLEASVTSDTGGEYTAQNLTVGNTYTIKWWLLEGTLASGNFSVIDLGATQNFTATQSTLFSYLYWNLPSNSTQHELLVRLFDYNGSNPTGNLIGWHSDYFTPSLPTITILNATDYNSSTSSQNLVDTYISNLSIGDTYGLMLWIDYYPNFPYDVGSSNHYTRSYSNFTAAGTGYWWNFTYSTQTVSGVYCATIGLYEDATLSVLSFDQLCFTIVYDDDLDGVWNEDDLCPNTTTNSTVDANGCAAYQRDSDGDGYNDAIDAFVNDATQWSDVDGDGYGDNSWGNNSDAFINDPTQWSDSDGDGYGDNPNGTTPDACVNLVGTSIWDRYGCPDWDGDGWSDAGDDFVQDATQWVDSDGDGYGDNYTWTQNSTTNLRDQNGDAFTNDSTQWSDVDGDQYGDNMNGNNPDAFPNDPTQWSDSDGDGYGDNPLGDNPDLCPNSPIGAVVDSNGCADSERDSDGDGVFDAYDDCVNIDASGWDTDGDGCIDDSDNDGVLDPDDNCRFTDATGWDTNGDGCIDDTDGDGVLDPDDDCRMIDASGYDNDGDGCIDDTDGDNVNDVNDACAFENASGWDTDGDGCIDDSDGDTIKDNVDQCRNVASTGFDADGDGCIDDSDNDGVPDNVDVCRYASAQGFDMDGDGCLDDSDGDLVFDNMDDCKFENATGYDANGDGCIDDTDGDGVKDTLDDCTEDASGFDADGDGCIDDTDGDGVKDNVDTCVNEDATGFDNDGDGCIDDTDGDEVKDDSDTCVEEDATGFDNDEDGCIDDTDGDGVKDNVDICVNEDATGFDKDGNGCIDDSDGDGINDALDAFPDDPNEIEDSDGDGVGDVADAYPMDASRSVEEGGISMPFWIALALIVFIAIGVAAVFMMRRNGETEEGSLMGGFGTEPQAAEDIYAMAGVNEGAFPETPTEELVYAPPAHAVTNEHGQTTWTDESGISWCQDPDGSLMRFDAESGAWVPHQ